MKKQPSGAQKRQANKQANKASGKVKPEWLEAAQRIGPPPDDPVQRVAWAGELCAQFLHEVATHPKIDARERWKLGAEFVRTIGMTAVKALYESRLKRIEATLYGGRAREELNGSDGLESDPTAGPTRSV
jgi:hypothetical protein